MADTKKEQERDELHRAILLFSTLNDASLFTLKGAICA